MWRYLGIVLGICWWSGMFFLKGGDGGCLGKILGKFVVFYGGFCIGLYLCGGVD